MSDIKYRSSDHLKNTIAYEKRRANTAKLRIEACEKELSSRTTHLVPGWEYEYKDVK